jgi:hypothetical protein
MRTKGEKVVFWGAGLLMSFAAVMVAMRVDVAKGWWSGVTVVGLFLMVSLVPAVLAAGWRWLTKPRGRIPDGTPGIRDVDHPCEMFEPGHGCWLNDCQGDGHYLCQECGNRKIIEAICGDCLYSIPDDCDAEHLPELDGSCKAYTPDPWYGGQDDPR